MKKLFLIFVALIMVAPAFAVTVDNTDKSKPVSAYYVKEAYNELDSAKQAKLTSSNVVVDPETSGPVVSSVTASNGTVTVTKSEITVPVGSPTSPTNHATIWIQ